MSSEIIKPLEPGEVVILANGRFPESDMALRYLHATDQIICCDGAAKLLLDYGKEPSLVIGDLDSIGAELKARFSDRLVEVTEQETNDLTKAIEWAISNDIKRAVVLGADGNRIDHTIANAALIAEHCSRINLMMVTNDGFLLPLSHSATFPSQQGQQVSIFSLTPATRYSSKGLKYPLNRTLLSTLWSGSLNQVEGDSFTLEFDAGLALVYINYVNR
ncbi:MAG: thiamine diphosphokinase [Gammaproteobacteria bacterium]|nr:thiamine diphosphokinase [Gammaproteobacteria bacterium]